MNEAIISPWFFYWVDIISNVKGLTIALMVCCTLASLISVCVYFENFFDNKVIKARALKCFCVFLPLALICTFIMVFTPSSDALYKMMIAKSVTPQALSSFIKDGKLVKDELKKDIIEVIKTVKETK